MKTTYTNMKPLNQYEIAGMIREMEQDPDITEIGYGNTLVLRDEEEIRVYTIVKEVVIRNERD